MKLLTHALLVSSLALLLLSGCGDNSGRVPITGTITLDGNPLPDGSVALVDEKGTSHGVGIVKEGAFTINEAANSEGVQPGSYKVVVESWEVAPGSVDAEGNIKDEGKSRIPEKYNSFKTTDLSATVGDGQSELKLAMTSG